MKARELRELSKEELLEKERQLRREIFNLRFQKESGQLGDTSLIKKAKRDLARVLTILREMQLNKDRD
ncbi:MAG: 50S ribosomal protein L29 [Deltaproteobacteria bacterium]|nr:MAG: 50S ribosomal protein L29 [Deltaproteobacteria bacterium]